MMREVFLILLASFYVVNATDDIVRAYTKHILSNILNKQQDFLEIPVKRSSRNKRNVDTISGYPQVKTTSGVATGVTIDDAHAFYEIPYAEPPVGALRFQPPQPIQTPQTINATTNNYLQCYQATPTCEVSRPDGCEQEDCLILNVFTPSTINLTDPSNPPAERLPVMFYIHGGSFKNGAGTQSELDGKNLASYTNTVVVVINYRLGVFGFLMHRQNGQDDIKGNQGLKDQQLALQWVQDNIANFGGDKNKVTIFGNSAGAQSVMFHTLSDVSKNLFSRSIQQSNPAIFSFFTPTPEISLRITDRLLKRLDCSTQDERECLLNAEPSAIIAQMSSVEELTAEEEQNNVYTEETFLPVLDGTEFTDQPINLYLDGKWNKEKEMIFGVNTQENENVQFSFPKDFVLDENGFYATNFLIFGNEIAAKVVEKYKSAFPPEGEDYRKTLGIELSHFYFDCPNRLSARYASNSTSSTVYFYANEHPVLVNQCVLINNGSTEGCYLAMHDAEVRYVMRTLDQLDEVTEDDNSVQNQFNAYWGNFAQTGNPNNGQRENSTNWPEYSNIATGSANVPWHHVQIKAPTSEGQFGYKEDICDFWDSINYGIISESTTPVTSTASNTTPLPTTTALPTTTPMPTTTPLPTTTALPTTTPLPATTALPTTTPMPTTTLLLTTTSTGYRFGVSNLSLAMCTIFCLICR